MDLAKTWWSLVVRGLVAIALGLIAFARNGVTTDQLAVLFFAYTLLDGLAAIGGAVHAAQENERWTALLLEGFASFATATVVIAWPGVTVWPLMYIVAAWAFATGALEIAGAMPLRKSLESASLLALSGMASLFLGCLMVVMPLATPFIIARWIGGYSLIFGVLLLVLGFRLRARSKSPMMSHAKLR